MGNEGYVYFFHAEDTNYIKMGISLTSPLKRRTALQTGCPYDLIPLVSIKVRHPEKWESFMANWWEESHIRGE